MAKFLIEPHFRLQEWVAEEKDYFRKEGLDYEFRELMRATDGKIHDKGDKVGAYQSFEEGRKSNVSCACHWTVNVAASNGHGKMYTDVYSVAPAGVFVAGRFEDQRPGRSRRRAGLGRLPVRQSLFDGAGARAVSQAGTDKPRLFRRHAVRAHGEAVRRQGAGRAPVRRALLLRRAAWLP